MTRESLLPSSLLFLQTHNTTIETHFERHSDINSKQTYLWEGLLELGRSSIGGDGPPSGDRGNNDTGSSNAGADGRRYPRR